MDYITAFILGLIGSLHCAGMCGPLVLAMPAPGLSSGALHHLLGRTMYNLGRISMYCLLGLVFGALGKTLALAGIQRWTSISLGVVLLGGLFVRVKSRHSTFWRPAFALVSRLKSAMTWALRRHSLGSQAVLGFLNGMLPCGLVYVGCAAAVAKGTLLSGAAYMAAFGAGTLPMMLAIGLLGRWVPVLYRLKLQRAIPVSVIIVAALLILRGMSLGVPYLSPDLSKAPSCCHP